MTRGDMRTEDRADPPARASASPNASGDSGQDSRVQRSRARVLTAAFELLGESGVSGFTIDQVAIRSGVAKTTIYRQWPSREALVLEAAARISAAVDVPDTGSVLDDVAVLLTNLGHLLGTARWASVVPSIVDVAERDPEFATIHGAIQRGHAAPLREVLARAAARGELSATADLAYLGSALIGPLYYRRWFSRESIDDQFVAQLIGDVLGSYVDAAAPQSRGRG
jgi:AcrR family transcriptional regulator